MAPPAVLGRWQLMLPGVDVPRLALKEPAVLDCDIGLALRNVIGILGLLPGADVMAMVR